MEMLRTILIQLIFGFDHRYAHSLKGLGSVAGLGLGKSAFSSVIAIALGLLPVVSHAAELRLESAQVLAVSDALIRFKAEGRELGGYGVWVETSDDLIDVVLVPNLIDPGTMGARFSGAPEIHYSYDDTGRIFKSRLLGK